MFTANNRIYYLYVFPLVTVSFMLISGCGDTGMRAPSEIVDVAVYTGSGAWDASVTASLAALEQAGYSTGRLDLPALLSGGLDGFRVLLIPGGDPRDYSTDLGPVGRGRIRGFVFSGGGFIGLGGGAAVADADSGSWSGIGLFSGDARWPIERIAPYPEYTITEVNLVDPAHPVGRGGRESYWTLYRWGPEFIFPETHSWTVETPFYSIKMAGERNSIEVVDVNETDFVVYRYALTETPAAVTLEFGAGRVFLCGFQPEIEENDPRDGTDFGSELNDPDTEWDIIERVVRFCLWEI